MMRDLVIATRNQGKLREIREILKDVPFNVLGLDVFLMPPKWLKMQVPLSEMQKKAQTISIHTGRLTLADDSGLVVDALDGAPGVLSARFSGGDATDSTNNAKLLEELNGVVTADRQAAFYCAMVLVDPDCGTSHFSGLLKGAILEEMQGDGGFGYDPLFMVREYGVTLAQLPLETKNRISHRGQALRSLLNTLQKSS